MGRNFRTVTGFSTAMARVPRPPVLLPAVLSLAGAAVAAACVALTASAGARVTRAVCAPARLGAPRLTAPCDGATVAAHRSITFTVVDADPDATGAPYLDLQTVRSVVDHHLRANSDGDGIFAQMTAVHGRRDTWTYTAARQSYPTWWDNRPGTYWVQAEQADPRLASGIVYGPITTVRVR